MALLVSTWSNGVQSVPKDYIMPPEKRAGDIVNICKDIPVINLKNDRSIIVQQIIKACQEFGAFQVINHGVPEEMMADMRVLYDEFFNMPVEDKLSLYAEKFRDGCILHTSELNYAEKSGLHADKFHFWKDSLKHRCYPFEEHMPSWPEKPTRYREEVRKYSIEVRKMGSKVLELIAEGLGLNKEHFEELSWGQAMAINRYPPCPEPSLAMGLGSHTDPNLITFLQQDHYGLQIEKDGKWLGVEPIPNAFVINLGCQIETISNGMLKSVEHRGVLNSTTSRTSIVTFFSPNPTLPPVVEPAKELVTSTTPQAFKSYLYNEFMAEYLAFGGKRGPGNGKPLDLFRI